ncbi:MAG: caspase family protein [Geminicoccaceae bacterium]|nr:caspase family protein [Geminicoccaceae bacterium]
MRTLCLILFMICLALPVDALARRVALVIGNGAYRYTSELPNPPNDARAVARVLREIGFEVHSGTDLDQSAMRDLTREFARSLDGAEAGLVFYAGHGLQVEGENYLLPVDAQLAQKADLLYEGFPVSQLLAQLEAPDRASVLILDACRNNPLSRSFSRASRSTVESGLARVSAGTGALIAFATAPGDVALDGEGEHSPFTEALLEHIATPGLEINQLMTRVRAEVYAETNQDQLPWTNSALLGEFYLVPGDGTPPPPPPPRLTAAPVETPARPKAPAPARPPARAEPPPFSMVSCTAPSGAAWAGVRFLTYQQCSEIGGDWRPLN